MNCIFEEGRGIGIDGAMAGNAGDVKYDKSRDGQKGLVPVREGVFLPPGVDDGQAIAVRWGRFPVGM